MGEATLGIFIVVWFVTVGFFTVHILAERDCEQIHNVWDCEAVYMPVLNENSPEDEELMP